MLALVEIKSPITALTALKMKRHSRSVLSLYYQNPECTLVCGCPCSNPNMWGCGSARNGSHHGIGMFHASVCFHLPSVLPCVWGATKPCILARKRDQTGCERTFSSFLTVRHVTFHFPF